MTSDIVSVRTIEATCRYQRRLTYLSAILSAIVVVLIIVGVVLLPFDVYSGIAGATLHTLGMTLTYVVLLCETANRRGILVATTVMYSVAGVCLLWWVSICAIRHSHMWVTLTLIPAGCFLLSLVSGMSSAQYIPTHYHTNVKRDWVYRRVVASSKDAKT